MRHLASLSSVGLVVLALLGGASGCSSDSPAPPPIEETPDEETPDEETPDEETPKGTKLPGLKGPVEVIVDDRAMPHIYASSQHDAALMQGYLMARDRFPQMEILKRNVTGRMAELLGTVSASALEGDVAARVIGYKRVADRIYASLPADAPEKAVLDGFAAGVNVYIAEVRSGTSKLPQGAELLESLVSNPAAFTDWTPQDSLAIGRYLSYALSYSAEADVALTQAMAASAAAFPQGNPRAGIFRDLWSFAPAREVFTREGLSSEGRSAESLTRGAKAHQRGLSQAMLPSSTVLSNAQGFFDAARRLRGVLGDESRGANNWVVSGAKTASGAPLLANDPHLSLPSPPLFWYSHLNTKKAGGNLDAEGISLVGVPGVMLGFNDRIAWGSTTANHDVTDVYEETITEGTNGAPATVRFKGQQVPIEIITETIKVSGKPDVVLKLENVPHHGIILPKIEGGAVVPRTASSALSVRWTGDEVSNEIAAFLGLNTATNAAEARAALTKFKVGAQSFVVATREGEIFWSTQSRLPVRDPRALTYDAVTQTGLSPAMVLPGDGSYEWMGDVEDRDLPQDANPAKGFIATANNDLVGTTKDGNPFNDARYLGWDYDLGHRISRITERLQSLADRGGVTPQDMISVQGDHRSPLGALLAPKFVAAARRVQEERSQPGTHPDLAGLVQRTSAAELDTLRQVANRLAAWTYETPPGVNIGDGEPAAAEVSDSIATALFNASMLRLVKLAFDDEIAAIGRRPDSGKLARTLQFAILEPTRLATYNATRGDTVLWDDLSTTNVAETRDERIAVAMMLGAGYLRDRLGADPEQWRWGKLHTLTLASLVPSTTGESAVTLPAPGSAMFPTGYPRPGDNFGVDASNFGMSNAEKFSYENGPVQRLVVEMTPEGPRAWNALPGGQVFDPQSTHHADEIELWRRNKAPSLYFTDEELSGHKVSSNSFVP
ncbi:penicillin acylase family protein [Hyalangium rubrum]|uniref:Penicillin acylase family protein n=1 Tax=Hyalangium rubrum TaxID=3103134 RepID=A0ABU5HCJ8_9BACT|nr:penicillin acylase family protein [Hyalangium sp. s54d21]MDY7231182.1 penicillin acylase family protein [Hyalangium sp. s54d21]